MQHDYTHIIMVLDRSGSMSGIRRETIAGVNQFLAEQKAETGTATLTLIQFDDRYEPQHTMAPLASVAPLTEHTYEPRGSTALLDAVGRAIVEGGQNLAALPEERRPATVLFAVLTDGLENASREYTRARVESMITHQRETYSWRFVFLGANQAAITTAGQIGIDASFSISFAPTAAGARDVIGKLSKNASRLRKGEILDAPFFTHEDRETLPDLPDNQKHR